LCLGVGILQSHQCRGFQKASLTPWLCLYRLASQLKPQGDIWRNARPGS